MARSPSLMITLVKPKRVLVQVKSGHVKSGDIRDLVGTVQRENAAIGVFITLETPSKRDDHRGDQRRLL